MVRRYLNIFHLNSKIDEVRNDLATLRGNIDERFAAWFTQAERMGKKARTLFRFCC